MVSQIKVGRLVGNEESSSGQEDDESSGHVRQTPRWQAQRFFERQHDGADRRTGS